MRFLITMNMPSHSGKAVHQMQVEHSSKTLDEFTKTLSEKDFVIVEEFYKARETDGYESRGQVAVGYRHIGKIKVMN